jgi:hypothetical protein
VSRQLILHIGLHKTGTSSLQFALFQLRNELQQLGWSYPGLNGSLAHHQLRRDLAMQKTSGVVSKFREYVLNSGFQNFIISSEGFDVFTPDQIRATRDFFKGLGLETKVIYFIRNQADMLESSIAGTKNFKTLARSETDTIERIKSRFPWKLYTCHQQWSDYFGGSNVFVEIYEHHRDTVSRFFEVAQIGINKSSIRSIKELGSKNVSVNHDAAFASREIIRQLHQQGVSTLHIESVVMPLLREVGEKYEIECLENRMSLISSSLRSNMEHLFQQENQMFSKRIKELPPQYFSFSRNVRTEPANPDSYQRTLMQELVNANAVKGH